MRKPTRSEYKRDFYNTHYERIHLAVPIGMKSVIQSLATQKGMSINAYIQDLVRQDQAGMFDSMQIADKNRDIIAGINGNMHDGYDIIFKDGYTAHATTKANARRIIIDYSKEKRA
jgi:hypothetical protein